jgi:hypothetical protein
MVAARRASRPVTATALRIKIVAIVTFVSFLCCVLPSDTVARCFASDTFAAGPGSGLRIG